MTHTRIIVRLGLAIVAATAAPSGASEVPATRSSVGRMECATNAPAEPLCSSPVEMSSFTVGHVYRTTTNAICEAHRSFLHAAEVRVAYGFPGRFPGEAYRIAKTNSFPHSTEPVLGGCIPRPATHVIVPSCRQCDKAREDWLQYHRYTD